MYEFPRSGNAGPLQPIQAGEADRAFNRRARARAPIDPILARVRDRSIALGILPVECSQSTCDLARHGTEDGEGAAAVLAREALVCVWDRAVESFSTARARGFRAECSVTRLAVDPEDLRREMGNADPDLIEEALRAVRRWVYRAGRAAKFPAGWYVITAETAGSLREWLILHGCRPQPL